MNDSTRTRALVDRAGRRYYAILCIGAALAVTAIVVVSGLMMYSD